MAKEGECGVGAIGFSQNLQGKSPKPTVKIERDGSKSDKYDPVVLCKQCHAQHYE